MAPKRKHSTSSAESASNEADDGATTKSKKARLSVQYNPVEICQDLYDSIRNHKAADGRILCEPFVRVPKRRSAPDYYAIIEQPIDMLRIQQKLKTDEYEEIEQLTSDIRLLVDNAKSYYKANSREYLDACALWDFYETTQSELIAAAFGEKPAGETSHAGDSNLAGTSGRLLRPRPEAKESEAQRQDSSGSRKKAKADDDSMDLEAEVFTVTIDTHTRKACQQLLDAIMTAKAGDRCISDLFLKVPDRQGHPSYYDVIKQPIDLNTITSKLQAGTYKSLEDIESDLLLMTKNARTFHDPKSQIYKDADTLKKVMQAVKSDIDLSNPPLKSNGNEKLRGRKSAKYADHSSGDEDNDSMHEKVAKTPGGPNSLADNEDTNASSSIVDDSAVCGTADPLWVLYRTVRTYCDSRGRELADPFLSLPSKRMYPDYYEDIARPISMVQIKSNLKKSMYDSLDMLASDFELLFSNAKEYNIEDSQIYKDAVVLCGVMREKKKELAGPPPKAPRTNLVVDAGGASSALLERPSTADSSAPSTPASAKGTGPKRSRGKGGSALGPAIKAEVVTTIADESEERRILKRRSATAATPSAGVPVAEAEKPLKKHLWMIYKMVHDYEENGRRLIDVFLNLPSRELYPDYYIVISEPIDMKMLEKKIQSDQYASEADLVEDLRLLFGNAKHFNEDDSQIYKDAVTLERVLKTKLKTMPAPPVAVASGVAATAVTAAIQQPFIALPASESSTLAKRVTAQSPLDEKLQDLYETVRCYTDPRGGRAPSIPFMKLPTKQELPEYYEVIKRPIDMLKIQQRMSNGAYNSVDDAMEDFVSMFDNACRFNEPGSMIYKDSLVLLQVALNRATELIDRSTFEPPGVASAVQDLMRNLMASMLNHQDDEGRCYSDSVVEMLQTSLAASDQKKSQPPLSLTQIENYLKHGCYRRVDRFQDDIFALFEYVRSVSASDSQVYEDVVEMQKFFITIRDELCKNGELLLTPALSYTERHLEQDIKDEQCEAASKLPCPEEAEEKSDVDKAVDGNTGGYDLKSKGGQGGEDEYFEFNGEKYYMGDFVYVQPREPSMEPHILHIVSLWRDDSKMPWLRGSWFYRPNETFHLATRKFLQKEVFRSETTNDIPLSSVTSRCYVMHVKDYFTMRPEDVESQGNSGQDCLDFLSPKQGISAKDTYVCESRYVKKTKMFKKLSQWQLKTNTNIEIVDREQPLPMVRVASIFVADKSNEKMEEDKSASVTSAPLPVLDKEREDAELESSSSSVVIEPGCTYYEQLVTSFTAAGCLKVGDCVYVSVEDDQPPLVARIDRLWKDSRGDAHFQGPWFVRPSDTEHSLTRLFYEREVFLSSIEDTHAVSSITGKCAVLWAKEYASCRPTEIPEKDVYICEYRYLESEKLFRKLPKMMRKSPVSPKVVDDEVYFMRKPYNPKKVASPHLAKAAAEPYVSGEEDDDDDDDDDDETPDDDDEMHVSSATPVLNAVAAVVIPHDARILPNLDYLRDSVDIDDKKKAKKKHHVTSFQLFSNEVRRQISQKNPGMSFGEISKEVAFRWKRLADHEKQHYVELSARLHAADGTALQQSGGGPSLDRRRAQSPVPGSGLQHGQSPMASLGGTAMANCGTPFMVGQYAAPGAGSFMGYGTPQFAQQGMFAGPVQASMHMAQQPYQGQMPLGQVSMMQGNQQGMPFNAQQAMPRQQLGYNPQAFQQPNGMQPPHAGHYPRMQGQQGSMSITPQPQQQQHFQQQTIQQQGQQTQPFPCRPPLQALSQHGVPITPQQFTSVGPTPSPQPRHFMDHGGGGSTGSPAPPPSAAVDHLQASMANGMPVPPFGMQQPPRPPSPLFVSVPPRVQHLQHSDVYLRYIEGLKGDNPVRVSNFESVLQTGPVQPSPHRLPLHWLGQGVGVHSTALNALHALRDHLLKDSLKLARTSLI